MSIKVSKYIVGRIAKIQRNRIETNQYTSEVKSYFEKYDIEFEEHEYEHASIVKGETVEKNGKSYLKVEGSQPAPANGNGTFCRQTTHGEDWYSGEYYIPIGNDCYIQIHYDM